MGDLISRQALCEYALNQKDKSVTPNDIMRFPSAQLESYECVCCEYRVGDLCCYAEVHDAEPCEDAVSRHEMMCAINLTSVHSELAQRLRKLQSVQPERKKGKWINIREGNRADCDQCGQSGRAWMNFCFLCGAEMEGQDER